MSRNEELLRNLFLSFVCVKHMDILFNFILPLFTLTAVYVHYTSLNDCLCN